MKKIIKSLLPLLICLMFATCKQSDKPLPPPNIIWINAEDIGPAFGAYGDTYAKTPNIDALAKKGLRYDMAYATAPICAPSRSCLITGVYATAMGTQHLRNEIPRTPAIGALPEYLREAGYFTSLYGKTDYNFTPEGIWDVRAQRLAPWRERDEDKPFFSMYTIGSTHEGPANFYEKYLSAVQDLPDSMFHDPAIAKVPPYYPDNDSSRWMWARYYDLISGFDLDVGAIIDSLEADGLMENTIMFVFSDHGFGMPRYKRWLNETGLRVPLIVYVPEAYQEVFRAGNGPGKGTEELVSFVDYAPTALNLAGVPIPEHMQGQPFLGSDLPEKREYIFGARSRADDMYEISRASHDDRYIYIRHYIPQYPYIQSGKIFSDDKEAFRLLRRSRMDGDLPPLGEAMFNPKPTEELYDLHNDPFEQVNLANQPEHQEVKERMKAAMHDWMKRHRDAGLLIEPEMMRRAGDESPYTMAQDESRYHLNRILEAAEGVGTASLQTLLTDLNDTDSGVRWWAVMGLGARDNLPDAGVQPLIERLDDESPAVQVAAAEVLCASGNCSADASEALARNMRSDKPWLALYAARSTQLIGAEACTIRDVILEVQQSYLSGPDGPRKYKDFNFSSFIGWALEVPLEACPD
ncbi:MAG: sulfatase-like hydrolase/transferase [Cyclobacteriaceae bacterium]